MRQCGQAVSLIRTLQLAQHNGNHQRDIPKLWSPGESNVSWSFKSHNQFQDYAFDFLQVTFSNKAMPFQCKTRNSSASHNAGLQNFPGHWNWKGFYWDHAETLLSVMKEKKSGRRGRFKYEKKFYSFWVFLNTNMHDKFSSWGCGIGIFHPVEPLFSNSLFEKIDWGPPFIFQLS